MHADTDAIRTYGAATADLADELRATAALLRPEISPLVTDAFGPVGTGFAAALAEAAAELAKAVTAISERLDASGAATTAAARDYDGAEAHSRNQIAQVGT